MANPTWNKFSLSVLGLAVALFALITFFSFSDQPQSFKRTCENQDPLVVQVGDKLFSVPIDKNIFLDLEELEKNSSAVMLCNLPRKKIIKAVRISILPGSSLLGSQEIFKGFPGLQVSIIKNPHNEPSWRDEFSKIRRATYQGEIENLAEEGQYFVLKNQKVIHFFSSNEARTPNKDSPYTLTCRSNLQKDFRENILGHRCSTVYVWSEPTNLSYRFYSPKIPSEKWVDLDKAVQLLFTSLEIKEG